MSITTKTTSSVTSCKKYPTSQLSSTEELKMKYAPSVIPTRKIFTDEKLKEKHKDNFSLLTAKDKVVDDISIDKNAVLKETITKKKVAQGEVVNEKEERKRGRFIVCKSIPCEKQSALAPISAPVLTGTRLARFFVSSVEQSETDKNESGLSILPKITSNESQTDIQGKRSEISRKNSKRVNQTKRLRKKELRRIFTMRDGTTIEGTYSINVTDSDSDYEIKETKTKNKSLYVRPSLSSTKQSGTDKNGSGLSILPKITSNESQTDIQGKRSEIARKNSKPANQTKRLRKKELRRIFTMRDGTTIEGTYSINVTDSDSDYEIKETKTKNKSLYVRSSLSSAKQSETDKNGSSLSILPKMTSNGTQTDIQGKKSENKSLYVRPQPREGKAEPEVNLPLQVNLVHTSTVSSREPSRSFRSVVKKKFTKFLKRAKKICH